MDGILKAVSVFKNLGNAIANVDPSHMGVAWVGVNMILQLILSGAEQNAAALQGLAQISPIITRYAKVEEIYIEQRQRSQAIDLNKDFRTQVVNLYTTILVYQGTIISHSKRNRLVQYARAIPKVDDWNTLLQDIVNLDAECRKFTQIFDSEEQTDRYWELKDILEQQDQQMEQVSFDLSHIKDQNEALINDNDRREHKEILDWVSTNMPHNDHIRILEHGKLNSDYAQSGKWLFCRSEFESWRNTSDESQSVLWLPGPVGTGKSSLVCLVVEQFLNQSRPIGEEPDRMAFFYCSRKQGTNEANSPKAVLRSILRQLAWSKTNLSVAPIVKESYRQWQQDQGYGGRELLADDCIKLLNQLIASNNHTTIIIDALDECSDFDELLSNLEEIMVAGQGRVRFLLSSRMHVPVQDVFPDNVRIEVGLDNKDDIELFIKTKIEQNQRRLDQCKSSALKHRIIKTLSDRAQGMFRWVELQLDIFFSSKSKIRRPDVFRKKLETLESGSGIPELEEVYDEIYDMNVSTDEDRSAAERTLKWIMCSRGPLSIEILVKAVSLGSNGDPDEAVDEDYILAICSNFIIIDHNQMVQFAHLSVREYLVSGLKHRYTTANANTQGDADATERDGFLQYTALYWPFHYSQALVDDEKGQPLENLVSKLLSPGEPSDGFTTCLQIWADVLEEVDTRELYPRIKASLNPTKSPVFTACAWGFYGVLQKALSAAFNLDERNDDGDTALAVATSFNHIEIMTLLLENGADANAIGSKGGSLEAVKLLIHHGADVTKAIKGPINDKWTPLHLATCREFEDIALLLLEKGASINAKTKSGSTPLHLTIHGRTAVAQLLLEHGADPKIEDKNGQTPLQKAAANGDEDMLKLLLRYQGLESEAKKWTQQAQFYNAVREGDEATVGLLLEDGVDMMTRSVRGEYPLHWAMHRGHRGVASLLLQKGADIDAKDKFGETPLLLACRERNEEMMLFLLDKGADINIKNEERAGGFTALSLATFFGEQQIVEMLLRRGASPSSVDLDSLEAAEEYDLSDTSGT
ncbi:uncharacterized protein N7483_009470 [Penicillium malachiteum]|uniref:uncharacterized protein n=1 Tax=Penicillium malachiteum TaxID=1324776 RepID=UPI00254906FA|nr:uncharacterized protein N7483_009470 [Penicillium malachiteum]KAJ5721536.1 hypothetical protein N7483_009470 [Penicillium malachiteum]